MLHKTQAVELFSILNRLAPNIYVCVLISRKGIPSTGSSPWFLLYLSGLIQTDLYQSFNFIWHFWKWLFGLYSSGPVVISFPVLLWINHVGDTVHIFQQRWCWPSLKCKQRKHTCIYTKQWLKYSKLWFMNIKIPIFNIILKYKIYLKIFSTQNLYDS